MIHTKTLHTFIIIIGIGFSSLNAGPETAVQQARQALVNKWINKSSNHQYDENDKLDAWLLSRDYNYTDPPCPAPRTNRPRVSRQKTVSNTRHPTSREHHESEVAWDALIKKIDAQPAQDLNDIITQLDAQRAAQRAAQRDAATKIQRAYRKHRAHAEEVWDALIKDLGFPHTQQTQRPSVSSSPGPSLGPSHPSNLSEPLVPPDCVPEKRLTLPPNGGSQQNLDEWFESLPGSLQNTPTHSHNSE